MTNKQLIGPGVALLITACMAGNVFAGAATDKLRSTGELKLGYLANAKPFTSTGANGAAEGYGAALCEKVATQLKSDLALPQLNLSWVPVTTDNAFTAVSNGDVDVLCTPTSATLERRKAVAFSIPTFAGGVRAVVRADAPANLRNALEATPAPKNVWRGSPALTLLEKTRFATVEGTVSKDWLASKVASFKLNTATVSVPDYASGIRFLLERKIDVFLAERDVVLAHLDDATRNKVAILNRQLTHQPLSLALPRGDDDFRLSVDTALTNALSSPDFPALYAKSFGVLDDSARTFFSWATPSR